MAKTQTVSARALRAEGRGPRFPPRSCFQLPSLRRRLGSPSPPPLLATWHKVAPALPDALPNLLQMRLVETQQRPLRRMFLLALCAVSCHPGHPPGKQKMAKQPANLQQQWDLANASAHNNVKLHCQEPERQEHVSRLLRIYDRRFRHCANSSHQDYALSFRVWPSPCSTTRVNNGTRRGHHHGGRPGQHPPRERPLPGLSAQQLRQEIARLERHILDFSQDAYGPLCDALEDDLAQNGSELLARKPEGQSLDQAVAKHKQAQRACS